MNPQAVLLQGPTASGKTDIAIDLAKQYPFEIISVDSAMVYRGMDIGTAKPSATLRKKIPHHLIDILDPRESYSCARFRSEAAAHMHEIQQQGKIPLLVGGTMLYFRSLQYGIAAIPAIDPVIRQKLTLQAENQGLEKLHEQLRAKDPMAAERIKVSDPQRIIRALEVYFSTGNPLSSYWQKTHEKLPWQWLKIVVAHQNKENRNKLIKNRFEKMLQDGFIEEVQALYERPDLTANLPAIRTVGYRQAWQYLQGKMDREQMQQNAIIATRQLAKRQMTWLRSSKDGEWFDAEQEGLAKHIGNYLAAKIFPQ